MASKAEQRKLAKLRAQRNQLRNEPRTPKGNYTKANRAAKADVDNEIAGLMGEMRRKKDKKEQQAQNKAARQAAKQAREEQRAANKKSKASWLEKAEAYGAAQQAYQGARKNLRNVVQGGIKERNKAKKAGEEFTSPDLTEPLKARSTALSAMQKARDELESEYASTHNLQVGKRGGRFQTFSTGYKGYIDSKGRVH